MTDKTGRFSVSDVESYMEMGRVHVCQDTEIGDEEVRRIGQFFRLLRIIKMFRIVRIFKLARHSGALKALGKTRKRLETD